MPNGTVRIIGGKWRSRQITFPSIPYIKPTPDRVRETLFNWLSPTIEGAYCLDLFAGSGALGLEALSRGAVWTAFVEKSFHAAEALKQSLSKLNATDQGFVYQQAYHRMTDTQLISAMPLPHTIDLIFLDPPFQKGLLATTLHWLHEQSFISGDPYLYIEHEAKLLLPTQLTDHWYAFRKKQAGQVCYGLWKKKNGLA